MVIGFKDGLKLFGVTVVCACAVFVATFFLNFYLDALAVREQVAAEVLPLYEAQLLTAKFICAISGACLSLVAAVLIVFYAKLYLERHAKQLGILSALGYPRLRLAAGFAVFGLSVFVGTALGHGVGYAVMPVIYTAMGGDGLPEIPIGFHAELLVCLVFLPALFFAALAVVYAWAKLRCGAAPLLRGAAEKGKTKPRKRDTGSPFLVELALETLRSKKLLAFFVAFAGFCFAAMVQMSFSMIDLASEVMAAIVCGIGLVLAADSLFLALTSLVNANAKTVAVMRACGYPLHRSGEAVLGAFRIPAYVGFVLGTLYQWGLLKIMVGIVFSDVGMPVEYSFNGVVCVITLAAFTALYELVSCFLIHRIGKVSVRSFSAE